MLQVGERRPGQRRSALRVNEDLPFQFSGISFALGSSKQGIETLPVLPL